MKIINSKNLLYTIIDHFSIININSSIDEDLAEEIVKLIIDKKQPAFLQNRFSKLTYLFQKLDETDDIYIFEIEKETDIDSYGNRLNLFNVLVADQKILLGSNNAFINYSSVKESLEFIVDQVDPKKDLPFKVIDEGYKPHKKFIQVLETDEYEIYESRLEDFQIILITKSLYENYEVQLVKDENSNNLVAFYDFDPDYEIYQFNIGTIDNLDPDIIDSVVDTIDEIIDQEEQSLTNLMRKVDEPEASSKKENTQINTVNDDIKLTPSEEKVAQNVSLPGLKGM